MSKYEIWSLALTATYDGLTFLLLMFVAYEAAIKPSRANIAFYIQRIPKETKFWGYRRAMLDFVLENRGPELKNIKIKSEPDFIGWDNWGDEGEKPKSTSEYFKQIIPYLGENERHQFFWCDIDANREVLDTPFKVIIEYDNPVFPIPRRLKKKFKFNFSALYGVIHGMNVRYDIHNVAQEAARIREELENIRKAIDKVAEKQERTNDREKQSASVPKDAI
jgi:hypothetical protein